MGWIQDLSRLFELDPNRRRARAAIEFVLGQSINSRIIAERDEWKSETVEVTASGNDTVTITAVARQGGVILKFGRNIYLLRANGVDLLDSYAECVDALADILRTS
jgi:hypothetical protein